jgi:hypothetical protein
MLIEVKDLKEGDEIIIPSNSNFKYLKVLKVGGIHPKRKGWNRITQSRDLDYYRTVKCSIATVQTILPITRWRHKEGISNDYVFETDVTKHNHKINIDLNSKSIWLAKRDI